MNRKATPPLPTPPEPGLVLIVDDEEAIAETLADLVTDLGYIPLVAANGRQALEAARARWPAVVVTDLMMPQMTGAELIAALRAEADQAQRVPPRVLLLTAAGARASASVPADAHLGKPFELEELERVLRSLLDSSQP